MASVLYHLLSAPGALSLPPALRGFAPRGARLPPVLQRCQPGLCSSWPAEPWRGAEAFLRLPALGCPSPPGRKPVLNAGPGATEQPRGPFGLRLAQPLIVVLGREKSLCPVYDHWNLIKH